MDSIYDIFIVTSDGPLWVRQCRVYRERKNGWLIWDSLPPENILFTRREKASSPNRPKNFWKK